MRASEIITENNLLPHRKDDLEDVADWMNATVDNLQIDVKYEPISKFYQQAEEMLNTYEEFPEDGKRTQRISNMLSKGEGILPIYVEANDPHLFVMEGRHRMVAFLLAGYDKIPVAYVSIKESK